MENTSSKPKEGDPIEVRLPRHEQHEKTREELEELSKPGRVNKAHVEFIDKEPGYSRDQLQHMREYYGLVEPTTAGS